MTDLQKTRMGLRIRDVRQQRGMTLVQLGEKTSLNSNYLGKIEHGSGAGLEAVLSIVEALDVSMDYIVRGIAPLNSGWGLIFRSEDDLESIIRPD